MARIVLFASYDLSQIVAHCRQIATVIDVAQSEDTWRGVKPLKRCDVLDLPHCLLLL